MRLSHISNPAAAAVLILVDMVLLAACYIGALFWALRDVEPWFYVVYENGWLQIAFVVYFIQAGFYLLGSYADLWSFSRTRFVQQLALVMGASFLVQALIGYRAWESLQMPQWAMGYGSGVVLLVLPAWRVVYSSLIRGALPARRILLLGSSPEMDEISDALGTERQLGYKVVGQGRSLEQYEVDGFVGDVDQIVVGQGMDKNGVMQALPVGALLDARLYGVQIESALRFYETLFGRVPLSSFRSSKSLLEDLPSPRPEMVGLQIVYSRLLAACILLLTLLPQLVLALFVKVTSSGPVLERTRVVGLNGVPFTLYSFRTTVHRNNLPELTTVGAWLRKLRLDLLPQFWNVFLGDMALVGPQPERPEFCRELDDRLLFYHLRHSVRPGMTGWAQISRPFSGERLSATTELEYDLYYVKHLSPALDIYIVLHRLRGMVDVSSDPSFRSATNPT